MQVKDSQINSGSNGHAFLKRRCQNTLSDLLLSSIKETGTWKYAVLKFSQSFRSELGWKGKILWQKGRGKEDRSKCKSFFDMQEFHSFPALFSGGKKKK